MTSRGRLGLAFCALLAVVAPAHAIIFYESEAGWFLPGYGQDDVSILHQLTVPPAVSSAGGGFSYHGALCPALGTPNYLCAHMESRAELLGNRLSLHSEARLTRHDATGVGSSDLVHADTVIEVYGMAFSAVAPPVGFAVFNFGLTGTVSSSASAGATVQAFAVATLQAPGLTALQCDGYPCVPIPVRYSGNPSDSSAWHPTDVIRVRLRSDVSTGAPLGVNGWDAEAVADFGDTLQLLSVEVQDENHVPVPGAYAFVPNADGNGTTLTISSDPPSTTTTVGATTTTTPASATTTLPATGESCGNCADDDGNGVVDFEEAVCCPDAGVHALTVRKARLARHGAAATVAVDATVAGTALADVVPGHDVFVQLGLDGGPTLFCARIPADRFVLRHRKAVFTDRRRAVGDAAGLTDVVLRTAHGGLLVHVAGRRAQLVLPSPSALRLVVAFHDPAGADRCARTVQAFKRTRRKGLRAP
jgi:hypothetical protein